MSEPITFSLDGQDVTANPGETIWQVARRQGTRIPHLCYADEPGYRPDGNCRACMVEVEGERVLAASCLRKPTTGMKVITGNERAKSARNMVMELLIADQPERVVAHDPNSRLWVWADEMGVTSSRFPGRELPAADASHPAMRVQLDACIHCNLCVRACDRRRLVGKVGYLPLSLFTAGLARGWLVHAGDRPGQLEFNLAIGAVILVDRHNYLRFSAFHSTSGYEAVPQMLRAVAGPRVSPRSP